jgi:hypothetical protein
MAFRPQYESVSPFGVTPVISRFMVYYIHRTVAPNSLDVVVKITDQRYHHRPDVFANDLYGDPDLFWIVGVRNGLQDPVFDFELGSLYTIPHPSYVRTLV